MRGVVRRRVSVGKFELIESGVGRVAWLVILLMGSSVLLNAQSFNYPALQVPTASVRDYTAGLAGGGGTTLFFQWREEAGRGLQWQLDAGLSDPKGDTDPQMVIGTGVGKELLRADADQPLDVLLTAGAAFALGNGSSFRLPVGASIGHTFDLENSMRLTPFVHPRLSVDYCGRCRPAPSGAPGARRRGKSTVSLNFDLGGEWQVNREFAVKAAMGFSGSDVSGTDDVLAVGVSWTPESLRKR